jgi:hypothetical protein
MANLDDYLATLPPMQRAKARDALEMQVLFNGGEFLRRHEIVERRIRDGGRLEQTRSFGRVLMAPSGAFLDARNITARGLAYAEWLISANG